MQRIDRDFEEYRVSREKCIEVLSRHGCFRSYTLRACITGGQVFEPQPKPSKIELLKAMPSATPPERRDDFGQKAATDSVITDEDEDL